MTRTATQRTNAKGTATYQLVPVDGYTNRYEVAVETNHGRNSTVDTVGKVFSLGTEYYSRYGFDGMKKGTSCADKWDAADELMKSLGYKYLGNGGYAVPKGGRR